MSLNINNIHFSYGSLNVLNGISLTFQDSTFYAIIGPNGCGKSTLLKCMYSFLKPNKGSIEINNSNLLHMNHKKRASEISYVAQSVETSFDFTVKDIVSMGRNPYVKRFSTLSKTDISHVYQAMNQTSVLEYKNKSVNELSGGEKQRAFIARALAQDTKIILLDEPVSMLDINHQIEIMDTIKLLSKKHNRTVICVLHDLNLASMYADRVILMNNGKVRSIGTPNEVLTKKNIKEVYKTDINIITNADKTSKLIMPKSRL